MFAMEFPTALLKPEAWSINSRCTFFYKTFFLLLLRWLSVFHCYAYIVFEPLSLNHNKCSSVCVYVCVKQIMWLFDKIKIILLCIRLFLMHSCWELTIIIWGKQSNDEKKQSKERRLSKRKWRKKVMMKKKIYI